MAAVDLPELKRWMRRTAQDTSDDQDLQQVLSAAQEVVDHRTGGHVDPDTPLRVYPTPRGVLILPLAGLPGILEISNPRGVVVDHTRFTVDLEAGLIDLGVSGQLASGAWTVSLDAGEGKPPLNVAVKIIAEHLWGTRRGSGNSGDARSRAQVRGDDTPAPIGFAVPNRAAELIAPYTMALGFA